MSLTHRIDDDACYRALCAHDARFDGRFFTAVTSTGIYCRPVCRVRTPRRENCRFFEHAAQAEHAGFRPCLRCRPELAPLERHWSTEDASAILAQQATRWLDDPQHWQDDDAAPVSERLAARLGVSDRHLRRVFEERLGVSPLQYLLTRKLLTAKQLLADTGLPITQIALASGFASVRRFNAAFLEHYRLNPTQLRRESVRVETDAGTPVRLGYRPPYDVAATLAFFRQRMIESVAFLDGTLRLGQTLRMDMAGRTHTGWLLATFDEERHQLVLRVSDSLREVLPQVIHRLRAALDLDADPGAINAVLHSAFPHGDGLRVPGALDGFELAVRAVLGQQITVAAARTLAQRLVNRFGEPIDTPFAPLTRLFPTPAALAQAEGDALGQLGIVKQRQAAIVALARGVAEQGLVLNGSADVPATLAALKAMPGIGDWTAQYIAMRALRWPDAFPAGDVALHKAMGVQGLKQPAREAEALSLAWKPWRSYAVVRAWAAGQVSSGVQA
ncbi:DNA-3-methyladenine glycosylase 2 family protein [Hydrogenophaga sp. BPS33]|uniref:DNA-3-methyladenine glycosylase 2 family protein n=1 Tax=Hydrogenophaga sp. BPS33 TaxID=2651974 RepID=UPI0013202397|nr:Ada metal-binding domain-containing protein [Hydrogenophaga sp. BPS33]QHE87348.1 helix-turn-helix domain-containing protein [Hydrogenophaga sp. BPS33]